MRFVQGRTQAGFSLVEQIMVLAVLAVLAGIAMPSMARLLGNHRLQAVQFDYLAAMRYARAEAVQAGTRVLLCPSRDGNHCGGGADWNRGWLLALDRDHDGHPDGAPLRVRRLDGKLTVLGSSGRDRVRFLPDGSALGSNLSLLLCSRDAPGSALLVVVSNAGRARGGVATPAQVASCAAAATAST
ncbi:GspH/FimT family pseudopilin [Fulvimonas sp. R45]|uniref:GspH/FimT family pseudopilin n=1 Tax=Fulvimonas sp. R45 TaxID=3045937 RepID=UPI00265E05D7|nr:GspH/FimT family pseudopilin [Fulvimonas sp. R45]MDO1529147.1 GspH/FimT family pseudopilin [Fulvimonas sp. R45]